MLALTEQSSPLLLSKIARQRLRNREQRDDNLCLLDWTRKHRRLLSTDKPFDEDDHKYIIPIYEDNAKEIIVCKAGQVGISEYLVSWILWSADTRQATGLYVFPNDKLISAFSAARFGPATERKVSSHLANIVIPARATGGTRGADSVTLKRVRDRFIYFRGGTVNVKGLAPQLDSIDADVLVLDEYDKMDSRAPAIAEQRLGHSQIAEVRKVSTPTYAGLGIHAEYQKTDQRLWIVPCLSCGQKQDLDINDLVIEWDDADRPTAWHHQDDEPYLACRKCRGVLDRLGPGSWQPTYSNRDIHGYHLSRLFVPHKPLIDIINGLRSTDETVRQQTYNQGLGLPYSSPNSQSMTDEILNGCKRDYRMGLPKEQGQSIYAGIDVGSFLHVIIRQYTEGDYKALYIGEIKDFDEAKSLLMRYKVRVCVVDALPETRAARGFQAELKRKCTVYLAYYTGGLEDKGVSPIAYDWKAGTVNCDRTRTLDETFSRFQETALGEAGGNSLPADIVRIQDYYKHLKSPERVFKTNKTGNQVPVYIERGPDHYAHAENYCQIASQIRVGGLR